MCQTTTNAFSLSLAFAFGQKYHQRAKILMIPTLLSSTFKTPLGARTKCSLQSVLNKLCLYVFTLLTKSGHRKFESAFVTQQQFCIFQFLSVNPSIANQPSWFYRSIVSVSLLSSTSVLCLQVVKENVTWISPLFQLNSCGINMVPLG